MGTFVKKMSGVHDFERIGYARNIDGVNRDFSVRYIIGRNGEAISILEEFEPVSGHLINVFWQIDYDPSNRVRMIFG